MLNQNYFSTTALLIIVISGFSGGLNQLAKQSFVFQKCYVTQSVCSPSRISVMTVLYPHTTDITYNNISLSEDIKCLPELVNDKEYKTAYMGKMAFGDEVFAQHGDNGAVLALINSFNDSSAVGKMQYGPPWWFLDHKEGIEAQLNDLSVYGVLGNFIGMLTDSRSFLSFPRHEYFRRILCNTLGKDVEEGLIPDDRSLLKSIIENICYYNVKRYLGIK